MPSEDQEFGDMIAPILGETIEPTPEPEVVPAPAPVVEALKAAVTADDIFDRSQIRAVLEQTLDEERDEFVKYSAQVAELLSQQAAGADVSADLAVVRASMANVGGRVAVQLNAQFWRGVNRVLKTLAAAAVAAL